MRSKELLEKLKATNTEPRPIHHKDMVELHCYICGTPGLTQWAQAVRRLGKRGWGYQCSPCLYQKISDAKTIHYDSDYLEKLLLVDTTSRVIKSDDQVELKCHGCEKIGTSFWNNALRSLSRYGHTYQCANCFRAKIKKRSGNEKWLNGIRAAAQTEEHKTRARANGKKRLFLKRIDEIQKLWKFGDDIDLQMTLGTDAVIGTCLTCGLDTRKELKKFIETAKKGKNGCGNCWYIHTKSAEYRQIMGARSTPAGSEARIRQSATMKSTWEATPDDIKRDIIDKLQLSNQESGIGNMTSRGELEMLDWIKSELGLDAKKFKRGGFEIDIYIPELKIGIEYNGLYWHSEAVHKSSYHLDKTQYFNKDGIRIIHIFENEWSDRKVQVKSFLKRELAYNKNVVDAGNLVFREIENNAAIEFFKKNHVGGISDKKPLFNIGAFFDSTLLCVASFSDDVEHCLMSDLAFADGWTINGILNEFLRLASKRSGKHIIASVDLRWLDGAEHEGGGLAMVEKTPPDYFYFKNRKVFSRQSRELGIPEGMTEHEHALADGLLRVYDCGKKIFVYKKTDSDVT